MTVSYDGDSVYTFSSGRTMYAHRGIVGIDPELSLTEGYDGGISWPANGYSDDLAKEDAIELADMMTARWQQFKATLR